MILSNTLIVLDLEATGTWVEKDKIIEIAMIKCFPDGKQETFHSLVNPEMPIPKVVSELVGIKDEDVKNKKLFKEIAAEVIKFLEGADLAGFNLEKFDLPLLERELSAVNISFNWKERKIFDAQKVFHLNEKRDLTAAYQFYCNKNLENAHSAIYDTKATLDILTSQVKKYGQGDDHIEVLNSFEYSNRGDFYDRDGKFRWWNGELYMMFGKYARKFSLKEVVQKDRGYLEWIIAADFNNEVKELVENALVGKFPRPPEN